MNTLESRLYLHYEGGGRIGYLYGKDAALALGLPQDSHDMTSYIRVGDEISYGGASYEVVSVNFKLENHRDEVSEGVFYNSTLNICVKDA